MEDRMGCQIGERAPDFKAEVWHEGTNQEIMLSRYQGQWVVLIFYPGDFTFV
jgi:alkyl hydroperoxide reductase subunit AhpC